MKNSDEFERLLSEIPHATSPLSHHQCNNLVDHGYMYASCVSRRLNVHAMYDDELLKHKYASSSSSSSPVSGFSLKSDGSSSSLLSNGGLSLSDIGSPSPPQIGILNGHFVPGNGFRLDFQKDTDYSNFFDDFNLSRNFSKMSINDEPEHGQEFLTGAQSCYQSPIGATLLNLEKYGPSGNYKNCFSSGRGFNYHYVPTGPITFGSGCLPNRAERLFPRPHYRNSTTMNPHFNEVHLAHLSPHCNEEYFLRSHYGITNRGHSRNNPSREGGANKPREKILSSFSPLSDSEYNSLLEIRGYIYPIAKDQRGCRFLQRMFDEGTYQDVQIVFEEIIDHVVELMTNPFGNYLMQKLLEVCSEEHRMHIVKRVTEDLVRISLNTHGTRVVQKLIETLKTRQQIMLVISALEPGFLALMKDVNGNHVVQKCLQCFTTEDNEFIFIAAAKYCVDIATHRHGCCVLQRCISYATGELRQNLVGEISTNGLLLAQNAYGNYVIQLILELKIPSATSKLTCQFEGHYVHLSRQKFSSHVVEKCLLLCNDEIRSKIIHELLSASYFNQLLQDPHANYVVQTALGVTEGRLHKFLVHAIESYKAISRNSPYSKRIFSHKFLKR